MELTYLAIGACGFVAACALVAVIVLHARLTDLEETVQSNYKWQENRYYEAAERLGVLNAGMYALGLEYKSSTRGEWVKKEETQA